MIKAEEYARRRRTLMRMIGDDGVAIIPGAPIQRRSRDVEYRYRQDSDFHYLTGFDEPEAVMVLAPGRKNGEFLVFCRERDATRELWDGMRYGPKGVVDQFAADDAFPVDDIDDILPGLLENCSSVYYAMGVYPEFDLRVTEWMGTLRQQSKNRMHMPHEIVALDHLLHDMRLYKSRSELVAMRRAAKIASDAHQRAMEVTRPGLYEYEIEAVFQHEFRRNNAFTSYLPIVGGGANACVLHYTDNNALLEDGDLLLIDAGCEFEYYASDLTRTFPVNGRFTAEQRAVYEIVLEAQLAAIEKTQVGNHWNDPHDAAVKVISKGLKDLGILKGSLRTILKEESYRQFFMHRTGHWIGIDVHDVGDYRVDDEWRLLESGMVTTIEPGIYIPATANVDRCWQNIGIRIEDDVAVTSKGPDVLSKSLIKEADDIERVMGSR